VDTGNRLPVSYLNHETSNFLGLDGFIFWNYQHGLKRIVKTQVPSFHLNAQFQVLAEWKYLLKIVRYRKEDSGERWFSA
jgi:hypothetical protein